MITPIRPSDNRLLRRFAVEGDQEAFEELVRRHAGMARAVCRRVLGPSGDADDAAQTAFVSLAKHAGPLADQLGPTGSLAGWLYRVAVNAALQQRRAARSRRRREAIVVRDREPAADGVMSGVEHSELLHVLDEELKELPPRYRTPLVLCHLEGKTQHEAAEQLGLTYGTLRRRLDRGRKLLKNRIGRRGVLASSALLAALLKAASAQAAVPTGFVATVAATAAAGPAVPIAVVKPRVPTKGHMPRTVPQLPASVSATLYSLLLAGLLTAMAIPPVVSLLASAVSISPSVDYGPLPPPYFSPGHSLNRSAV